MQIAPHCEQIIFFTAFTWSITGSSLMYLGKHIQQPGLLLFLAIQRKQYIQNIKLTNASYRYITRNTYINTNAYCCTILLHILVCKYAQNLLSYTGIYMQSQLHNTGHVIVGERIPSLLHTTSYVLVDEHILCQLHSTGYVLVSEHILILLHNIGYVLVSEQILSLLHNTGYVLMGEHIQSQ